MTDRARINQNPSDGAVADAAIVVQAGTDFQIQDQQLA
jgi:hypothetical protein